MIRISEMVFPGHPDKFCDQVADAIVGVCLKTDPNAYCQVEVAIWSDQIWMSGGLVTKRKLPCTLQEISLKTGRAIGYKNGNWIDAEKYKVTNTVCEEIASPLPWTTKVNDQCIAIGYAGYDPMTHYLPPEHFIAHTLRLAITESCKKGLLLDQGPDGKLMVRMREEPQGWIVEHILVTLQQRQEIDFLDFCRKVEQTLKNAYDYLRSMDKRWLRNWNDIEIMINPNGPLLNGGSDGDNGQTGRKLVMDFYGPRIPIGGGALSGKDPTHIDRAASYCARDAAVRAVQSGAKECMVRLAYAPNSLEPLDIEYTMEGRGVRQNADFFRHDNICQRHKRIKIDQTMARGDHFFSDKYHWNGMLDKA